MIAGLCGPDSAGAARGADRARLGYHAGLLSLAAMKGASEDELIDALPRGRGRDAAGRLLPAAGRRRRRPAVRASGGASRRSTTSWRSRWRRSTATDARRDPRRGRAGRETHRALHRQRRPHRARPADALRRAPRRRPESRVRIRGRPARALERVDAPRGRAAAAHPRSVRRAAPSMPSCSRCDSRVTDCNAAFFDVANGFRGCIAGCHEVLRRQGLARGHLVPRPGRGPEPGPGRRNRPRACAPTRTSTTTISCASTRSAGSPSGQPRPDRHRGTARPYSSTAQLHHDTRRRPTCKHVRS